MTQNQPEKYIGETEKNLSRLREGDLDDWITTYEAAQISRYHVNYIRKLLQTGEIKGRKWGNAWMINRESLLSYLQKMETKGNRRGAKKKKELLD